MHLCTKSYIALKGIAPKQITDTSKSINSRGWSTDFYEQLDNTQMIARKVQFGVWHAMEQQTGITVAAIDECCKQYISER